MGTWKNFKGSAGAVTLNSGIGPTTATLLIDGDVSGWPDGSDQRAFVLELEPGTDDTERVLCSLLTSGTPSSIQVLSRGWDGTPGISHGANVAIQHVLDADSITDLESHVYDQTRDDHGQYLTVPRHDTTARHAFGVNGALGVPGVAADVGTTASAGTGPRPATENHVHALGALSVPNAAYQDDSVDSRVLAPGAIDNLGLFGAQSTPLVYQLAPFFISETAPATPVDGQVWLKLSLNRLARYDLANTKWIIIANGPFLRYTSSSVGSIANGSPVDFGSWSRDEETESFTAGNPTNRTTFTWPANTDGVYRVSSVVRLAGGTASADNALRALEAVFGSGTEMLQELPGIGTSAMVLEGECEKRVVAGETMKITVQQNSAAGILLAPAFQAHELEIRWVRP